MEEISFNVKQRADTLVLEVTETFPLGHSLEEWTHGLPLQEWDREQDRHCRQEKGSECSNREKVLAMIRGK